MFIARDVWLGFKVTLVSEITKLFHLPSFHSFTHFPSTSRNAHDAMTDASDKEMRILDSFSLNESQAPRIAAKISSGTNRLHLQLELEDGTLATSWQICHFFCIIWVVSLP